MSILASWEDFENGGMYSRYHRFGFFSDRADFLERFPGTVLVLGAGWGYLVDELRSRGREAWGCELSDYALRSAHREVPKAYPYIVKADAGSVKQLKKVGPGHFDVAVTEDLLQLSSSEKEADRFDRVAKVIADKVVHCVSFVEEDVGLDERMLWRTREWYEGRYPNAAIWG